METAFRLLLAYCDPEVGVPCNHFNDLGHPVDTAIVSLANAAMSIVPDDKSELLLLQPMRLLLPHILDIDERDLFGRTALLASVESVKRSQFPCVAQMLLQFGANPLVVDHGGAGMLHFILRTASACNNWNYTQESIKPLKTLMVRLLNAQCDPNLLSNEDLTPSDLALSPVAWVIWCEVVQDAGLDMLVILKRDDQLRGFKQSDAYVQGKFRSILHDPSSIWTDQSVQSDPMQEDLELCIYCTQPDNWTPLRPPFDQAGSYMVNTDHSVSRELFSNHRDGSFCQNGIDWGSCRAKSHSMHGEVTDWPAKTVSWRKHVAFRLWRDGFLQTPRQANLWATGRMPD